MQSYHSKKQSKIKKPVQFIHFDGNKNVALTPESLQLFKTFDHVKQLHIITVAGKYRTGKSYILNRVLLNQSNGFEVGPTINACTKGLWIWPEIVQIEGTNGQIKHCLIVDTEGLGSLEEGQNTDIKIFLLAMLLSSFLIYNSVGSIDEKALESLNLVINLATILQKQNTYDSQELINSFPSFLWLLRDFSLKLEDQNGLPITSTQYLENALKNQKPGTKMAEHKNILRKQLKTFFRERDCFTLIRPTQKEEDLQNLSKIPENKLRPEFVQLISQLKATIQQKVKPKVIRGKPLSAQGYIQLCQYYIKAINSGKIPTINSHWDNICVSESQRILEKFLKYQESKLKEIPISSKKSLFQKQYLQVLTDGEKAIDLSFLGKLEKCLCKEKLEKVLTNQINKLFSDITSHKHQEIKFIIKQSLEKLSQGSDQREIQKLSENLDNSQEKYKFTQYLDKFQKFIEILENIKETYEEEDQKVCSELYQNLKEFGKQILIKVETDLSLLKQSFFDEKHNLKKLNDLNNNLIKKLEIQNRRKQNKIENNNEELKQIHLQYQKQKYLAQQQNYQKYELIIHQLQDQLRQFESTKKQTKHKQAQISKIMKDLIEKSEMLQNNEDRLNRQRIQNLKLIEQVKEFQIKVRKITREKDIIKSKYEEYFQENIRLKQTKEQLKSLNDMLSTQNKKMKIKLSEHIDENQPPSEQVKKSNLSCYIEEIEYNLKSLQNEKNNLQNLLQSEKQTSHTLMMAPQNKNYLSLKKNYQLEIQNNRILELKYSKFNQIIKSYAVFQCSSCHSRIQQSFIKKHYLICHPKKIIYLHDDSDDIRANIDHGDDIKTNNGDDIKTNNGDDIKTNNGDDMKTKNGDDMKTKNGQNNNQKDRQIFQILKDMQFDVSYYYCMLQATNNILFFTIEISVNERYKYTLTKNMQNLQLFFKYLIKKQTQQKRHNLKIDLKNDKLHLLQQNQITKLQELFRMERLLLEDPNDESVVNTNQERRIFLYQLLQNCIRKQIWCDVFYRQYFALDLHIQKVYQQHTAKVYQQPTAKVYQQESQPATTTSTTTKDNFQPENYVKNQCSDQKQTSNECESSNSKESPNNKESANTKEWPNKKESRRNIWKQQVTKQITQDQNTLVENNNDIEVNEAQCLNVIQYLNPSSQKQLDQSTFRKNKIVPSNRYMKNKDKGHHFVQQLDINVDENQNQINFISESVNFIKTTKFTKKTFKFAPTYS